MKKIVISLLLILFLLSPVFVSAQAAATSAQLTQDLIKVLTQLIAQLQQEIASILSQGVTLTSAPTPTTCTPNWQCTGFDACINGTQAQICTDSNNCNTTIEKPFLNQSCTSAPFPFTNSSNGYSISTDWSGYAIVGTNYTAITGSWIMPQVTSSTSLTSDATWIGIGGITSPDLIQIGTETFSNNGNIAHQAFYETLPQDSENIPMTINAGDSITASLTEQSVAGQWSLSIKDNTNGHNFQTTILYTSSNSSAEWIEEMPSNTNSSFIPIDNFGTMQFTGGSVVENETTDTISQSNAQIMTLVNSNNQPLDTISNLGSDGSSFAITRTSATPTSSSNFQQSSSSADYRRGLDVQSYTHFLNK